MLAALITALLWSCSSIASSRAARFVGGASANRARLSIAAALLIGAASLHGTLAFGASSVWFLISGASGLALGDLALFLAYERIGTRLPVLLTHCLAAPIAGSIEWCWLGTALTWSEGACGTVILLGVALALAPAHGALPEAEPRRRWAGIALGVLSATGFALSGVLSRKGFAAAAAAGAPTHWLDASALRAIGGLALVWILAALPARAATVAHQAATARLSIEPAPAAERSWRRAAPYLLFSAIVGPALGVICYQYALAQAPSGLVQAVIALVPVLVAPLAWWIERDRPTWRTLAGGALAVAGAAGLALAR